MLITDFLVRIVPDYKYKNWEIFSPQKGKLPSQQAVCVPGIALKWERTVNCPLHDAGQGSKLFLPREKFEIPSRRILPSHLSGLHLLSSPPEGHVGVVVGGAIPLLLLDLGDEGGPPAILALPHPVVVDSLDQVVILVEQQLGFLQGYELQEHRKGAVGLGAQGKPPHTHTNWPLSG